MQKKQEVSLSKLVEFYFLSVISGFSNKQSGMPPITTELSGMIKSKTSKNDKMLLTDALVQKHL